MAAQSAHGHWCTFTDLYHTIPYHTIPYHPVDHGPEHLNSPANTYYQARPVITMTPLWRRHTGAGFLRYIGYTTQHQHG